MRKHVGAWRCGHRRSAEATSHGRDQLSEGARPRTAIPLARCGASMCRPKRSSVVRYQRTAPGFDDVKIPRASERHSCKIDVHRSGPDASARKAGNGSAGALDSRTAFRGGSDRKLPCPGRSTDIEAEHAAAYNEPPADSKWGAIVATGPPWLPRHSGRYPETVSTPSGQRLQPFWKGPGVGRQGHVDAVARYRVQGCVLPRPWSSDRLPGRK